MNYNPKISIITVCFNSQNTLRQTIESVNSQDYNNIEYIIIDGESTDNTLKIIQECDEMIDYFVSEKDNGIYDAMNKGIKAATGNIIGILNSDDFYNSTKVISDVVSAFVEHQCDSVYGDLVYVKEKNTKKIVRYWQSGEFTIKKLKQGWMLPHPTLFVRKFMYDKFGLYDEKLKNAADYEMILRLLYKHNISVSYLPKTLVRMRQGGQSNLSISNRLKANKEDSTAWTKNQLNKPILIRFKKPLLKIKQFFKRPTNEQN